MPEIKSAEQLKEQGNLCVQRADFHGALDAYTEALQLEPDNALRATLYRNRAMVRLKVEEYEGAEADCDKVLEMDGADSKALYRRALAREQLEKIGGAFKDAKEAARLQPGDKKIKELCEHLVKLNSEKMKQVNSTENRVQEMLKMTFDQKNAEQKSTAMNNLLVLSRESEDGAQRVWQNGKVVAELLKVVQDKENWTDALAVVALHILDELIRKRERGLCKCAAAGGDDYSKQTMEEGTTLTLARTCKEFLLDLDNYSVEVRRFACEALSYLSLDADVKEFIVQDTALLEALVSLGKVAGALCVFTLANIYVNLTNSYEKPKVEEELVRLAQFAKHHVPETHPLDTDEHVEKRVKALVKGGAVSACVSIAKTESKKALELLARCMMAFCTEQELCGQVVSEGGAKLLLTLYKEAEGEGKIKAAHGLAKLGVASDPNITFAGQRMYEVVKPMVELLHPECEGIANYDALLTLTNLASVSDSVRKRILKERAMPKVDEFWFMTDHENLRAAAAELMLNMLFLDEFYDDVVQSGNDRLKLWALYCDEGEDRLRLASSAGFAMLTHDETACKRFLDELGSWPELFVEICQNENPEVQRRCIMAIANIVSKSEALAARVMATEVFKILVAVCKVKKTNDERDEAVKEAQRALDAAEKFGVIKPTDRELFEKMNRLSTVPEV